jgi:DNA-binding MarR family transcriptional regulator
VVVALSNYQPESPVEQLVVALYRLGAVQRAVVRDSLAELGGQGLIALSLIHRVGPQRVSAIADRLHVDLSVASRQVAALVRAGYAARTADPEDRRAQRIAITPDGERIVRETHERMVAAYTAALPKWPEEDILALAGRLDQLREDFAAAVAGTEGAPR